MLIVAVKENSNGARANQLISFPLPKIPEGYVAIPEALVEEAIGYLPWLNLEQDEEGNVVAVLENSEAKAAFIAMQEAAEAEKEQENAEEPEDEEAPEEADVLENGETLEEGGKANG